MLINTFPAHFFIEFFYGNHTNGLFLNEQTFNREHRKQLLESYGLFNGCENIAYAVERQLYGKDVHTGMMFTINDFKSDFIDNIMLIVDEEGEGSSYNSSASRLKDGKFNPLTISIAVDVFSDSRELVTSIMHELMHAYEDYMRKQSGRGNSLATAATRFGYDKNDTVGEERRSKIGEVISRLFYFLNGIELNAYVGELKATLISSKKSFSRLSDAIDYIKGTNIYEAYTNAFRWSNKFINETDEEAQKEILLYANKYSNQNFKTYNQFRRWLSGKVYKFQKRFNTMIPKMCAEYMELGGYTYHPDIKEAIEQLENFDMDSLL